MDRWAGEMTGALGDTPGREPEQAEGRHAPRRSALPAIVVATLGCYAVGYPLALIGGYGVGWVLVTLGGVGLLAIGADVVRRVARSDRRP